MYEHIIKIENIPVDKNNWWFLVPRMIVDKTKYRGKGRPRKNDYRIFPGPNDFVKVDWKNIEIIRDTKGWVMSRGDGV